MIQMINWLNANVRDLSGILCLSGKDLVHEIFKVTNCVLMQQLGLDII